MVAVPVVIAVLWLASLSAQVGVVWPNYAEQKDKSEQSDKGSSEDKSKKGKSDQADEGSSKSKSPKAGKSSSAAGSKAREHKQQD
jgi:cytoskeletal protein RodZ